MELPAHENPLENNNMKGMVHKNSVEKLEYIKRQRSLEKQKRYFVRQHSRDENEIKQILQRLQFEQQIHDHEEDGTSQNSDDNEDKDDDKDDGDSDRGIVNPYPLIIVPKFGPPTPLKDANTDSKQDHQLPPGVRTGRRKSLEYEDIDNGNILKTTPSPIRTTVLAYSFINKLRAPIAARKSSSSQDQGPLIDNNMWVGDPEYISSIRRPRKTVAELNHHKSLKRAKSDLWLRSELSRSTSSLRPESPRLRKISADELMGRASELRKGSLENIDIACHSEKRKTSRENKTTSNREMSPNISPRMSRTGSFKTDKKQSEKKKKQDSTDEDLKQNIISVEISHQKQDDSHPCEDFLRSPRRIKEDKQKSVTQTEHKRKSSLKKKKSTLSTDVEHEMLRESGEEDVTSSRYENNEESKSTRKISFADQELTPNISLKRTGKKKPSRKLGTITGPGSLENIKHSSDHGKKSNPISERKPRSKSTGTSPVRSPTNSPLVTDRVFFR
ncbi:hypothetical protein FSP39_024346 [Pinctada imbricata]|uniref:Uncharacterized protein n=1 Tax=Pinctada imbricata TaxID=66713 RepID=A0AA89CCZ5_PINIB|nr:hypothetical protein FSP39_024346 [Pinctada imbricata]